MKKGDLIMLKNEHASMDGAYGYDEDLDDWVLVANGSIGMLWEEAQVPDGKFCVLVQGRVLWFDPLDRVAIDEAR